MDDKSKQLREEVEDTCSKISKIISRGSIAESIKNKIKQEDCNINGVLLPIEVNNNKEYREQVEKEMKKYLSDIKDKPCLKNLIGDVELICNEIIDILDLTINGNNNEAERKLSELLKTYTSCEYVVSELDKSYAFRGSAPFKKLGNSNRSKESDDRYKKMMSDDLTFFRGRVVERKDEKEEVKKIEVEERKDIISLPYSKKHLSRDLRFSSENEICLYLGTTSYVCSQECRWDEKSQYLYMAAFEFNDEGKKLKILNLVITKPLINGLGISAEECELRRMMVKLYPLILATSFTVKTSDEVRKNQFDENIKYEYLLTQRLIKSIKQAGIDGIAYLSRQGKNDFQYPHGVNLVIPMGDICKEKEYSSLYNYFKITDPVLVEPKEEIEEGDKESYINKNYTEYFSGLENTMAKVYYKGESVFYGNIHFSKWDNYLVNKKYDYFKI